MYAGDALLQAIGAALAGNITGGVHERQAPQPEAYPYTVIDQPTETTEDLHDRGVGDYTVTLHVWSITPSHGEAQGILAEIDGLLHHAALTVAGVNCWSVVREFTGPGAAVDEFGRDISHTVARYRFGIEETP